MRTLSTNSSDDFRVKAYAGTNGVLLAMDLAASRRGGFLGFAIEQKRGTASWRWLLNSLTFPGIAHTLPRWGATPSNIAPIQKFRWADYTVEPGQRCRYRVHLAYEPATAPVLKEMLEVSVLTDDGHPRNHEVQFNRAVAASQGFGRQFPELDALLSREKSLPIEQWPSKPRDWLQHGLLDCLLDYIQRARGPGWALDVAIYEYELAAVVDEINAAHKLGALVRVIYHAKGGDEQTAANESNLRKIPKANKRARVTSKIFHDKFIVLSKIDGHGTKIPQAVLCGSTNFTENGLYRQANVVHVANDPEIASRYLATFDVVWNAPDDVGIARKWITQNNPIDTTKPIFAGFSPRVGEGDLDEFVDVINGAEQDLLFATAFQLPERVLDAMLGKANDDVLRYGIQNSTSRITGFHADRTAEFTTPAMLSSGLEGWVKEGLRGQRGNLLVHLKAILADFTTDNPTIISGSHNLSVPASSGNDENFLIIRGDSDLADRYGLEVLRFYEHYRFRHYAKLLKLKQAQPLSVDDSWSDPYYKGGSLKELSRLRFSGH